MGTIQDPNPDRDWLKRNHVDTSTNPYSIDARTEMMGRLAEGIGSPAIRAIAAIILVAIAISVVLGVLDLL